MQVNLDSDIRSYTIRAYEPGAISLTVPYSAEDAPQVRSGEQASGSLGIKTINSSFIVSPRHLLPDWPPASISDLQAKHFDAIIELQPELVLLGTGARLTFPPPQILAALHRQHIGVEVMDTPAACRTYNILMTEGRFVVAGLIND